MRKREFGRGETLGGKKRRVPAGTPPNRPVLSREELGELWGLCYFGKGGMFSKREMDRGVKGVWVKGGFGGTKDREPPKLLPHLPALCNGSDAFPAPPGN